MTPYKNPEQQREAQRELMRQRRAAHKAEVPPSSAKAKSLAKAEPVVEGIVPNKTVGSEDSGFKFNAAPSLQPLLESNIKDLMTPLERAKKIAELTRQAFEGRGWVLWKLKPELDNEIIVVARDEFVRGYPEGYPVFTDDELYKLNQQKASLWTYSMVIEAKKASKNLVTVE